MEDANSLLWRMQTTCYGGCKQPVMRVKLFNKPYVGDFSTGKNFQCFSNKFFLAILMSPTLITGIKILATSITGIECCTAFINLHLSPIAVADPSICLQCKEKHATRADYYSDAIPASKFDGSHQDVKMSAHLICGECLLGQLEDDNGCMPGQLEEDDDANGQPEDNAQDSKAVRTKSGRDSNAVLFDGQMECTENCAGSAKEEAGGPADNKTFGIKCPACSMMISYKNLVEYIKSAVLRSSKNKTKHPILDKLAAKLFSRLIGKISPLTFLYSLGYTEKEELEAFMSYFGSNEFFDSGSACYGSFQEGAYLILSTPRTPKTSKARKTASSDRTVQAHSWLATLDSSSFKFIRYDHKAYYFQSTNFPILWFPRNGEAHYLIDDDLEEYFKILRCIRNKHLADSSPDLHFLNAKILAVLNQPNIPVKPMIGYLFPYISETQKTCQSRLIKKYVEEYKRCHRNGIWEEFECLFEIVVQFAAVPTTEAYILQVNAYARHSEFSVKRFLDFISRNAGYLALGNSMDAIESKRTFKLLCAMVCNSLALRSFEYEDLFQIRGLGQQYPYLKGIMQKLGEKYLQEHRGKLPLRIKKKIEEYAAKNDLLGMEGLISLYTEPKLCISRLELFAEICSLPRHSAIRLFSLIEFVDHDMAIGKEDEYLWNGLLETPAEFCAHIMAIALYPLQKLVCSQSHDLNSNNMKVRERYKNIFIGLSKAPKYSSLIGGNGNSDFLLAYAFAHSYNVYLDKIQGVVNAISFNVREPVSNNMDVEKYKIDLPEGKAEFYQAIYGCLIDQMLNSPIYTYSRTLHLTIQNMHSLFVENGVNLQLSNAQTEEILRKLVWAGIEAIYVRAEYLLGNEAFEYLFVHVYFEYCCCTHKNSALDDRNSALDDRNSALDDRNSSFGVNSSLRAEEAIQMLLLRYNDLMQQNNTSDATIDSLRKATNDIISVLSKCSDSLEISTSNALLGIRPLIRRLVERGLSIESPQESAPRIDCTGIPPIAMLLDLMKNKN